MITTDFLVIGSGIAGLNFALNAARFGKVVVVTKKEIIESNTNYAQGGIAAVISKDDNFKSHIQDTLKTGCGICDKKAVKVLVKNAPAEIKKLVELGVGFNREHGHLALSKEGGHSKKRIVHAGDMTGREIERALVYHVRNNKNIEVYEDYIMVDMIIENNKCIGGYALDIKNNKVDKFFSKATILATGGVGQVYKNTSNPRIATGDGIAIAFRAGAEIEDIEFIQFHPTTLDKKNCPHFLISETVRGEGGKLINSKGKSFMHKYHPMGDLAPRDIVSRGILTESEKGKVYLDIRQKGAMFLRKRFPTIFEKCYWYGIDMANDLIPISPAAHYSCGGVKTDIDGRTNIGGLFAFGEVACTGVHGANRLASNSLLESLVFSEKALKAAVKYTEDKKIITKSIRTKKPISPKTALLQSIRRSLKNILWRYVGIIRNEKCLRKALKELERLDRKIRNVKCLNVQAIELRNMVTTGKLITIAALKREESRGTHYREDFPSAKNGFKKHLVLVSKTD